MKSKLGLEGRITISRVNSTSNPDYIRICVGDVISGTDIAEVEVSLGNFALLITGMGYIPCSVDLYGQKAGMRREHKSEVVTVDYDRYKKTRNKKEFLLPFEVDGWKGYAPDLFNHQKQVSGTDDAYRVSFERWVEDEQQ